MSNPHPPHRPSNRDKGTDRHLSEKGIDAYLFKILVKAGCSPGQLAQIIERHDGKKYSRQRVGEWRKQLLDEWEVEKTVKSKG